MWIFLYFVLEAASRAAAQAKVWCVRDSFTIATFRNAQAEGAAEVDLQHFEKILPKLVRFKDGDVCKF